MRLLTDLALPLLLLLTIAIAVVGFGAAAVLRMPHRGDDTPTAVPDPDHRPVA
ncbi:hypothetical protein [Streptomyces sp. CBMA156]|uniref:hypothetical protein n=1 Tax=Streptomyces sp. CBMA156 TaxID=1930280 RepID=UPI001661E5CD|nr:hypothetical protein [Streptomyces sp. CBMA156]